MVTVSVLNSYADNLFAIAITRFCTALSYEKSLQLESRNDLYLGTNGSTIEALSDALDCELREMSAMVKAWEAETSKGK